MSALLSAVLDLVYPPECAACGELGREPFCTLCHDALLPAPPFEIEGADSAVAVFAYGGPIAEAIHRLKYRNRPDLARPLGALMRPRFERLAKVELIVPVPMTRRRAVHRGYNQARELARHLGAEVAARALVRTKERPQVGLQRRERFENLEGAFLPGPVAVRGRSVLVVDDVVTTGATATAAVRVLRAAGAARVSLLALAREG